MGHDNQIRDELIRAFNQIKSLINNRDPEFKMDYSRLFRSKKGKKFGKQVNVLIAFTAKGVAFSFPIDRVYPQMKKWIFSEEFRKRIQEAEDEEIDLEFIDAMKKVLSSDPEAMESDILKLFDEEDQARFLALLTFSLYSYSEVFVESLINEILSVPVLAEQLWQYLEEKAGGSLRFKLEELKEYLVNPQSFLNKKLKKEFRQRKQNPYNKLKTILKGLRLSELVNQLLEETQLQDYQRLFNEFQDIRHKIAHQQPFPSITEFETSTIKKKIDELHDQLKQQSIKIADIPPQILEIYKPIFDWLERTSPSFAITLVIPLMAVVYPALIDQTIISKIEYLRKLDVEDSPEGQATKL